MYDYSGSYPYSSGSYGETLNRRTLLGGRARSYGSDYGYNYGSQRRSMLSGLSGRNRMCGIGGFGTRSSLGFGCGGYSSYGSYGSRRGILSGVGSCVTIATMGLGAAAIGVGKMTGKAVVGAGRGMRSLSMTYRDKCSHEKEFQRLRKFDPEIKIVYDGSEAEFGQYLTEHGYAYLEPYSAVEFTVQSKYGKNRVCIYLPGDVSNTGLGEDSEGEAIITKDDWFDMLLVPEEHQQFYSKENPLECTILNLCAYYVAPRNQMVKPENRNCVGLLLRTQYAVDILQMIASGKQGCPPELQGAGNALKPGTVLMISDLQGFFAHPAVREYWGELSAIDPTGEGVIAEIQDKIIHGDNLDTSEDNGVTSTTDFMFGRPRQKLPASQILKKSTLRIQRLAERVVEARVIEEVSRKYDAARETLSKAMPIVRTEPVIDLTDRNPATQAPAASSKPQASQPPVEPKLAEPEEKPAESTDTASSDKKAVGDSPRPQPQGSRNLNIVESTPGDERPAETEKLKPVTNSVVQDKPAAPSTGSRKLSFG